ncbi:MAG TPA: CCA tRNA nucleotidyltransferase [Terriglobales bacterium]|nr:CCA tRNA nucleotidyltransferase [Terriglobales bacterium]
MLKQAATDIVRTLRQRGHQAYLVGGCVRDLLLGRQPADYDVATDATPAEVMRIFPQTYAVGAQFGVVLVPVDGISTPEASKKQCVEVATFRSDGLYSDGRHPDQVRFSKDPKEDVQRRDFTINGLLLDPLKNDEVLDFVGGRADLSAGIIRTIGEPHRRFGEDKLRMLRAVRFAARFGYSVDIETMRGVRELAPKIHEVSRERVSQELLKMLTEGAARRAFELLDESGLLPEVLPEVAKMKGVDQPPQFHPEGDVWVHTLMLLEQLPAGASPTLALGALLHDVGKPPTFRVAPDRIRFDSHAEVGAKMTEEICARLRLSNEESEKVTDLVAGHMRFAEVKNMRDSTFKRFVRTPNIGELLELHRIDCLASHRDLSLYQFVQQRLASMPQAEIRPQPLVTGDDLIAAGYAPGPEFKTMLALCEDAQLEGKIRSKDEGLALIKKEFPARGSLSS